MLRKRISYTLALTMILLGSIYGVSARANSVQLAPISDSTRPLEAFLEDIEKMNNGEIDGVPIFYPPLIPPLKRYLDSDEWSPEFLPDYSIPIDSAQLEIPESQYAYFTDLRLPTLTTLLGDIERIDALNVPPDNNVELDPGVIYRVQFVSSLRYSGENGEVYLGVVRLSGLNEDRQIILGGNEAIIDNHIVWMSEEGGQHHLSQVSFICGEYIIGILGEQPTAELIPLISNLSLNSELFCQ